jgi:FkbM family methyltransferase
MKSWLNMKSWLRAMRRLPDAYWHQEAMEKKKALAWHGARVMVPDRAGRFYSVLSPANDGQGLIQRTHEIFSHQAAAYYLANENRFFIQAVSGKSRLLDLGAAEGFFSALFAAINGARSSILSVDPMDPNWTAPGHLELVRRANTQSSGCGDWRIAQAYVTGADKTILEAATLGSATWVATLEELCQKEMFEPDIIKMDVESSEYDIVLSSLEFLKKTRPVLIIELHNKLLRARGKEPGAVVEGLQGIGYRLEHVDCRRWQQAENPHLQFVSS